MFEILVEVCIALLGIYAAAGVLFALLFVSCGIGVVDHAARDSSWTFRWLVFPGAVGFWPLLLRRWRQTVRS